LIGIRQLLLLIAAAAVSAFGAEKVEIIRDGFGVPHIYARTAAGAAYGSGYVQAADRGEQLLSNLGTAGHDGDASALSPGVRAIVAAYCAGANAYFGSKKIDAAMVVSFSRIAAGLVPAANDILISSARSIENAPIAVISPTAEWSGGSLLYAIEEESADGFAFAGMTPAGLPFPLIGHSNAVAISAHGEGPAGPKALNEAWALVTSKTLEEAKAALSMGQFPAQRFFIATSAGDIYDSREGAMNSPDGILMAGGGVPQALAMLRELIGRANTFSVETAAALANATEVYKAEAWQLRLAKSAPGSEFVRMITGWNRKAEWNSRPALAFYLFKMSLGADVATLEPPPSLTEERLRAALRRAQDQFETEFAVDAGYGSIFRIMRDGERRSWPIGGGTNLEAGMATPREIAFERRGALMIGHRGQAGLMVVALSKPVKSVVALPFGESESPDSPHFEDQARELFSRSLTMSTWFQDRKNLEKRTKDRKELTF
jgi:acyl-homoserine lactone acylase PvdQ